MGRKRSINFYSI